MGDGVISGDTTLLKKFTVAINVGFDEVMPLIYAADAKWQYDDANHSVDPVATTDLVSGQQAYGFVTDEQGNSILEIRKVYVKDQNGVYVPLKAVDETDQDTDEIHALNAANVGMPSRYDKLGTSIYLDPVPDYSTTAGVKVIFSRSQSYFASTDTTKTPGIPRPFHELLALYASRNWVAVNKSENTVLLGEIKDQIAKKEGQLTQHLSRRSKDEKPVMRARLQTAR